MISVMSRSHSLKSVAFPNHFAHFSGPIAILATLFHGMWYMAGQLLLVLAITLGTRFLGVWVMMKSEDHDHTPNALEPTAAALADSTDD